MSARLDATWILRLFRICLVLMHRYPSKFVYGFLQDRHGRSITQRRQHGAHLLLRRLPEQLHRYNYGSTQTFMAKSNSPLDASNTVSRLPPIPNNCHRFVLMRHGESAFNNANIFTGWCDVALTQRGIVEAVEAGEVFLSQSLHFRKCYVSLLSRSIVTAHRALDAGGITYTPLEYDYRWNERHYGALQGLSKEQTAIRMGRSIVMKWRRSYSDRPPLMTGKV
jgi:hypothetical protein